MLEHGGRLRAAAQKWDIPLAQWMDLSTGIAPQGYPVPALPPDAWQRLPEDDDGLEACACSYYASPRALALPGSQVAIQTLPRLRAPGSVLLLAPTYAEYGRAWQAAGHRVLSCAAADLHDAATTVDVVMIGNPNNPTGERFARARLKEIAAALRPRGGWLIVDEAFADCTGDDGDSLAAVAGQGEFDNLIVLRSLGKFFGLAGARVGFALAAQGILQDLAEAVGPWAVSHPARVVAQAALADTDWQRVQSASLQRDGKRLMALLREAGFSQVGGTKLFAYFVTRDAGDLADFFARRGILLRVFEWPEAVRIGLPASEAQWLRLLDAFKAWGDR